MSPVEKLDRERAVLVVVDIQEAFRRAIPDFESVARASATLARGAGVLDLPVIVTEQYPQGLGRTVEEVSRALPSGVEPLEKQRFSAAEAEGFDLGGRDQALVCGIETHVCVNQTVLDLAGDGIGAQVAVDAVGSRTEANRRLGLERMERAGAAMTSVETALFELVGTSGTDEFKRIQKLVLELAPKA